MLKRAKELEQQRKEARKSGRSGYGGSSGGGMGSSMYSGGAKDSYIDSSSVEPAKPSYTPSSR